MPSADISIILGTAFENICENLAAFILNFRLN